MDRGGRDYEGGNGGGSRYGGGGNKRSYDDDNQGGGGNSGGGNSGGGYKRSRHEGRDGGNSYYRNNNNSNSGGGGGDYRNGGARDDRRYGGSNNNSNSYDRRGGGGGQGGGAVESDTARAWRLTKKGIVELGEDASTGGTFEELRGSALRDQLSDVAMKIKDELSADRNNVKISVIATLAVRCVGRLSHKTSLYAVVVGLVNETHATFGRHVVDTCTQELQKDLDFFTTSDPLVVDEDESRKKKDVGAVAQRVRLLVRFLGELVSTRVVKGDDLLAVLDTLQSVCTPDDFTGDNEDALLLRDRENAAAFKDFFATIVLDTLLQAGSALAVGNEDIYESLLSRCQEYISNREEESNPRGGNLSDIHASNWLERRLRLDLVWEPESDSGSESSSSLLAAATKKCDLLTLQWDALNLVRGEPRPVADAQMNPHLRWKMPGVLYPQELFERHFTVTTSGEPHALTMPISVDFAMLDNTKIPRYEPVFRIFGEDSGAVGAPLANLHLASYLTARGHLSDAIETFHPKPVIAAKHLLGVSKSYNARFADADVANLKTEYVLLESLLVKALNEKDAARLAYLCSVLTHLVKTDAKLISPAVAIIVELLFREVPMMNASAVDAFVKLFSHFLSNFEFKWQFARWTHVLEASEDDPQRLFVSSVIERCVRLSYLQHMQSALPDEFHALLPPAPMPRIIYKANDQYQEDDQDGGSVSVVAKEFYAAVSAQLKSHPPASALAAWLDETLATTSTTTLDRNQAVEIVFTAILEAGAATFTHCRLMVQKYGVLGDFFQGEDAELLLVKTVGFVWVHSPQHIGLILNMMLRHRVVHATTIAKWIFLSDAIQQYSWPYVWGILDETVTFVVKEMEMAKRSGAMSGDNGGDTAMADDEDSLTATSRVEMELRELLKHVFAGFNRVLAEYKTNCDADGISYKDNWFLSALAQMKAIAAKYRVFWVEIEEDLLAEVFSGPAADDDAKRVFEFVRDSYRSN